MKVCSSLCAYFVLRQGLKKMLERAAKSRALANAAGEGADVALSMNVVVWKGAIAGGTITAY
nr:MULTISPECIES: hypothetical protein [Pseudomonas]